MHPPLHGLRIVEFEGIGPGPLAGMMLADMGADVTVIARSKPGVLTLALGGEGANPLRRGKREVLLDLKTESAVAEALKIIERSDGLIEGNRPGVMERLGLGPDVCLARNPKLGYGRMTGWGQSGPLATAAGHDLNYVALSGVLSLSVRRGERPIIPPTVVGDASGALGMAYGMVCALFSARTTGAGRIVDAAILDIVAMLGTLAHWVHSSGKLGGTQPSPFHDSPFYDVYECADAKWVTLGSMEPQFYALLLKKLELHDVDPAAQFDTRHWPALKARFVELFRSRSRDAWCALLEGSDVCFAPVLSIEEATRHPQNVARGTFTVAPNGAVQSCAAPRFMSGPRQ